MSKRPENGLEEGSSFRMKGIDRFTPFGVAISYPLSSLPPFLLSQTKYRKERVIRSRGNEETKTECLIPLRTPFYGNKKGAVKK